MNLSAFFLLTLDAKSKTTAISDTAALIISSICLVICLSLGILFYILHQKRKEKFEDKEFLNKSNNADNTRIVYLFLKNSWLILGFFFSFAAVGSAISLIFILTKL